MQEDVGPPSLAPLGVAGEARPARRRPVGRSRRPVAYRNALVAAGVLAAVAGLSVVLYQAGTHAGYVDSDSATVVLEGAAMRHGNLALSGWALSRDSFWTVDALFYLVGVLVDGVRPALVYAVPAVIAAIVVVAAASMARSAATLAGRVAGVVTVLCFLALPSRALSLFYLQGPYHVGTALYALGAFAGLRRRRFGWGWAGAVALFGFGMLGDLQLAIFGVVPAFGAGLLAMARRRSWRAGLTTAAAAPASVALAFVVREIADRFGTFAVNRANPQANLHQMVQNLHDAAHWWPSLLGVGPGPYEPTGMPAALSDLHVVLIAALVLGVVAALYATLRGVIAGSATRIGALPTDGWHLEDMLLLAFLADVAVFARLDSASNPQFGRYLTAATIFGAILAARFAGRLVDLAARRRRAPLAAAVAGCLFLAFGGAFGETVAGAAPVNPATTLATFLEQHHLTRGLGDYWSASIVTVESAGRVVVRPVVDAPNGRVFRYSRQNDVAWYEHHQFQFVVEDQGLHLVQPADVQATFGHWKATYVIGPYQLFTFSHPIAVSTVPAGA